MNILHCSSGWNTDDPRVLRARSTWSQNHRNYFFKRDARDLGDTRDWPFLKDVLAATLERNPDFLFYTDDDIILRPGLESSIMLLAQEGCNAFTGQRVDVPNFEAIHTALHKAEHMGRALIGFRASWLREHLAEIPDYVVGCSTADLMLSAMCRKMVDRIWTMENCADWCPKCETIPGLLFHESHRSRWLDFEEAPAEVHNRKLTAAWFQANLPESLPKHLEGYLCTTEPVNAKS